MRLKEIYNIADEIAPFSLSREFCETYGGYDNSGILLDCGLEVKNILFSLDCSMAAIKRAEKAGAELIFTHHPAIYAPLKRLLRDGEGKEILACAAAGISVISAHLNLDCAAGGIDESLMQGLGGTAVEKLMEPLSVGGYGRVYTVKEQTLSAFTMAAGAAFGTDKLVVYDGKRAVKKVASFCGAGMSEKSVAFAIQAGADTFVSSDGKHHLVKEAVEAGMNVILFTHYAAEDYGFYRFMQKIQEKTGVRCEYFKDERYL